MIFFCALMWLHAAVVRAELGRSSSDPARSCEQIKKDDCDAEDGMYWLDRDNDGSAGEFFCDMSTDGGGWTRIFNLEDYDDCMGDPWQLIPDLDTPLCGVKPRDGRACDGILMALCRADSPFFCLFFFVI